MTTGIPVMRPWAGEQRRAEAGRQPRPPHHRRVPRLRRRGLGPAPPRHHGPSEAAPYAAQRRARVSEAFAGQRLIVPAGGLKVRSNDTDYVFRPHSAFAHLTGLGGDREPDAVLVLEPVKGGGHEAILYFRPLAGRDSDEFFADTRYGEFWVGARPTIEDIEAELGLTARHIDEFADAAAKDAGEVTVRVVRDADRELTTQLDDARTTEGAEASTLAEADDELAAFLSTFASSRTSGRCRRCARPWRPRTSASRPSSPTSPRPSRRAAANAGSRASSACTPATRATASATTPSALPATTPPRCTGSRTPATCTRATSSCSMPASRWTRSSPRTSPARCPPAAPSPTRSARSTTPCMPPRRPAWPRSSRATSSRTCTRRPSG